MIGGGATAAGMGHLVVMDDSEAQFASRVIRKCSGTSCATSCRARSSTMRAARSGSRRTTKRWRKWCGRQQFYSERGVAVEVLDAQSLREAEPNLAPGVGWWVACAGRQCDLSAVCGAVFCRARAGAGRAVVCRAVRLSGDARWCAFARWNVAVSGVVVNAAGSWSPQLTRGLSVKKRKGHLVITDRYPKFLRHQLVELGYLKSAHSVTADSVAFNIQPRTTGQLLIGSSRQYEVEDSGVDVSIVTRMLARAIEYLPGLGKLSALRTWTGFRAATPDKLPLIGPTASGHTRASVSRDGPRRPRHHHFARHGETAGRSNHEPYARDSNPTLSAVAYGAGDYRACLISSR